MKLGTREAKELFLAHGWEWQDRWLGAEVKPIKRRRSTEQNALYWVHVAALAEFSGLTKNEMHEEILSENHGYDLVEFRGTTRKRPRGRSHNLTTEDFSALIEIAQRWAAEMGVPIPEAA